MDKGININCNFIFIRFINGCKKNEFLSLGIWSRFG